MKVGDYYWVNPNYKPHRKWGILLDRDGVVLEEVHLLHNLKDYKIFPKAVKAIKLLNDKNIPVVLTTNQTVAARGLVKKDFIKKTHDLIRRDLKKKGAWLDGIFYCLHSPHADIKKYRLNCSWRKPKIGMLVASAKRLKLNLEKCWGIGDKARDTLAYKKVGMKDVLVETGHGGKDGLFKAEPTFVKKNILEAIKFILKEENLWKK